MKLGICMASHIGDVVRAEELGYTHAWLASIAIINAIAPGRTFLWVGTGNTAMRIMGKKPHRIAEFERYLGRGRCEGGRSHTRSRGPGSDHDFAGVGAAL